MSQRTILGFGLQGLSKRSFKGKITYRGVHSYDGARQRSLAEIRSYLFTKETDAFLRVTVLFGHGVTYEVVILHLRTNAALRGNGSENEVILVTRTYFQVGH